MLNLRRRRHVAAGLQIASITVFLALFLAPATGQEKTITVIHTNDMHAAFLPREAYWIKDKPRPLVGGFPTLQYLIDSIRMADPPVLLLDGGDVMTGNPVTDRPYKGAEGGILFDMMNMMGYDAWCPGNHDFDISQDNFSKLVRIARFPTLSANLVDDFGKPQFGQQPYAIIERGDLRVGIIGLMSQYMVNLVNQNNLVGIKVLSPSETLRKYARIIEPRVDLLIALTHQGVEEDSLLALEVPQIDLIVGGHSHTRLKSARRVNGVLIVQAGSNTENLGYIKVSVENGRVVKYDSRLIPAWQRPGIPRTRLAVLADSMQASIDQEYSLVLGTLTGDWTRKDKSQSAIGTFFAEAQRTALRADVAFMNSQGIRKDMPAGPVTKRDMFELLPFRNAMGTFQLRGYDLRNIVQYYLDQGPSIQIAGLSARYRKQKDGPAVITGILVGDSPLDDQRMYVCAASDYFIGESKRYLGLEIHNAIYVQRTLFAVCEEAFRSASPVTPTVLYTITEER